MCFTPQRRALLKYQDGIWAAISGPNMWCFVHFHFHMCFAPQRRALFRHHNCQKNSGPEVFCTSKRASRHNGVHFLDVATSKSAPNLVCLVQFSLPNVLRAAMACTLCTSQHPKRPGPGVFCAFSLPNVLRSTTAYTFSTSYLPKALRTWRVFVHFSFKVCCGLQRGAVFHLSSGQLAPRPPL